MSEPVLWGSGASREGVNVKEVETAIDIETLQTAISTRWPAPPSKKAERYVNQFFAATRSGSKIAAHVEGNHGTYLVSIEVHPDRVVSACSCYIGKRGHCHHCEALAHTFFQDPDTFAELQSTEREAISSLDDLEAFLHDMTLETLLAELKAKGITQKAFGASIGMSTRHLSAVKSSELRNRFFHELGATKLACLWVLENIARNKT